MLNDYKVVVYSNGDNACNELIHKLEMKNINFTISNDYSVLKEYNLIFLPYVELNDKVILSREEVERLLRLE